MVVKKPRIVIIGAGMAGLTAANKLYTCTSFKDKFDLSIVEGGSRIGGRINTSEFGGDRIEMGATWIHGIGGSPIHQIAQQIDSLNSDQPWECMDGFLENPKTVAEGGFEVNPSFVESVSTLFTKLMDFAQGKSIQSTEIAPQAVDFCKIAARASNGGAAAGKLSVGSYLRRGIDAYWECLADDSTEEEEEEVKLKDSNFWSRKSLEEAIFAMHENVQRTYTSAGDLLTLDFEAESEYIMFPGEEITIAKGYLSIIEALASVLPKGLIQLGKKVAKIDWQSQSTEAPQAHKSMVNGCVNRPVKLHFCDGSFMYADHVIVTVSLGVLKAGIGEDSGMFNPPLPSFKTEAITRLGFGVVNKLFLQLDSNNDVKSSVRDDFKFPFLQMAFHRPDSELRHKKIPWWMRRTASICPIYKSSSVLLSWFAGKEALELESLDDDEIINGVSSTTSSLLTTTTKTQLNNSHELCNGNNNNHVDDDDDDDSNYSTEVRFSKVLKSKWGNDPLFLGSYSYVAVGSSGDDMDSLAEPLPKNGSSCSSSSPLQILFAGEATHRTHYSTTHGAYFSGLREANRLLQHYHCFGV